MTTCGDITAPMNKLKQIDVYGVPLRCWCSEFCKKLGGQIGEMVDRVVMVKDGTRSFPVRLKENSELVTIDWNEGDTFVENVRISGTRDKKEPSNNIKESEMGNGRYDKNHLFRKYKDRDRDRDKEKEVDGRKALDKGKASWIRKTKKKPLLYPSCKNYEDGYWVVFKTKYLMEADENTKDGEVRSPSNSESGSRSDNSKACILE
ncbi:hypothetical protein Q3G72_028273 [Acer saccharum]|nr:hypothetical protein Q3G72_028273 [Acer saccharum]